MVLIGNDNKKRLSWPIAKIIELIPGRDGEIRTVRLKTQHGTVIRPVQRIFPLEVQAIANSDKELKEESISVKSTKPEKVLNINDAIVKKYTSSGRLVKEPKRLHLLNYNCYRFETLPKSQRGNTVTANYMQFWFHRFRSGIFDVKDAPRTGRPVVNNVDKITEIIKIDRHVSSCSIAQELKIDHKTVLSHLRKVGFKKKFDLTLILRETYLQRKEHQNGTQLGLNWRNSEVVRRPNNGRNDYRGNCQNNHQGNQWFESRNRFQNDDRRFNDRRYQFLNRVQNDDFSRGYQRNRGSSENFSQGGRKQMGRLNVLKVSDVKGDQTQSINESLIKLSAIYMSPEELPHIPILLDETFTKALWDTGVEISFISEETYQKYFFFISK
ncbi:DUF5641 domain-containing protein [Trichonephila clavipes]|nr:DUF5641 domain-containing protein [Trichonephila clavipes]